VFDFQTLFCLDLLLYYVFVCSILWEVCVLFLICFCLVWGTDGRTDVAIKAYELYLVEL